jgi:hypothetical protein
VNGWLRKTKDGKPYLSLSFREKSDKSTSAEKKPVAEEKSGGGASFDDAIPFAPEWR